MDQKQCCGKLRSWPLPLLFLLLVIGAGNTRAQQGRGPALVIKGIAQYQDSALFDAAIGTLEEALESPLDSRDSTRALFYLSFSHFKLGQQEDGDRLLGMVVRRNPDAKLPLGAEEFADRFGRIKQQVKEGSGTPADEPAPEPADTMPAAKPPTETVHIEHSMYTGPQLGNYLTGAAAGAILGAASYFASVQFDHMAADKVKAYSMAGDSASAEELKGKASQYHSLGSVFYYSSYPLVAIGFYLGLKLSESIFPGQVALLDEGSPTRVYCSLDKDLNLSFGVRRSLW